MQRPIQGQCLGSWRRTVRHPVSQQRPSLKRVDQLNPNKVKLQAMKCSALLTAFWVNLLMIASEAHLKSSTDQYVILQLDSATILHLNNSTGSPFLGFFHQPSPSSSSTYHLAFSFANTRLTKNGQCRESRWVDGPCAVDLGRFCVVYIFVV